MNGENLNELGPAAVYDPVWWSNEFSDLGVAPFRYNAPGIGEPLELLSRGKEV